MNDFSENTLLGGRVKIKQPKNGFRAAIDSVLLAAAVPAKKGQTVLEAGSGSGAASLCLAARVKDISITGLEIQKEITELAIENVRLNKMEQNIKFITGDVADVPKELRDTQFHHVMTNPPFVSCGTSPADSSKAVAHMETSANLAVWLDFCIRKLKPKGTLTLIHRADRLDEILSLIYGRVGGIEVIPLYPKVGKNAKRVIVRGRKSFKSPMIMSAGLVLHEGDCYTPETENILREMKPLE